MRIKKSVLTFFVSLVSLVGVHSAATAGAPQAIEGAAPGQFDYYVLSLSWSPEFCHGHSSDPQCGQGYGFVLHGLWPENNNYTYPADCSSNYQLSPSQIADYPFPFPTTKLVEHEWPKHGTCSGLDPVTYVGTAANLFNIDPQSPNPGTVVIPTNGDGNYTKPTGFTTTHDGIVKDFASANNLSQSSIAPMCSGKYLSEVYICYANDGVTPTACDRSTLTNSANSCRGTITVPGN
jgi:ribonuclease T2